MQAPPPRRRETVTRGCDGPVWRPACALDESVLTKLGGGAAQRPVTSRPALVFVSLGRSVLSETPLSPDRDSSLPI